MRPLAASDLHGGPPGDQNPHPSSIHSRVSCLGLTGLWGPLLFVGPPRPPGTSSLLGAQSFRPGGDTETIEPHQPPMPCPAPSPAASSGGNSRAKGITACSARWLVADSRGVLPSWPALEHFCHPRSPHPALTAPSPKPQETTGHFLTCSVDVLPVLDVLYNWDHNTQHLVSS